MEKVSFIIGKYTQEVFYLLLAIIVASLSVGYLLRLRRLSKKKQRKRFDDPKD
jgi:hypothetical protein